MTSENKDLRCTNFDQFCNGDQVLSPGSVEEMCAHVQHCQQCQAKIAEMNPPAGRIQSANAQITSEHLSLQFVYSGQPVTCKIVKPFLPGLCSSVTQTRIPTPITVHLDNCLQCKRDLETISNLNLTHKQLADLGQLFAFSLNHSCLSENSVNALATSNFKSCSAGDRKKVVDILLRPDSPFVTVLETSSSDSSSNTYPGFPVKVSTQKNKPGTIFVLRPLLKTAVAAAVVIAISAAWFTTSPVNALVLADVVKAFRGVSNSHFVRFSNDTTVIQERWISKSADCIIYKTSNTFALLDMAKSKRYIRRKPDFLLQEQDVPTDEITAFVAVVNQDISLVPFDVGTISPSYATWTKIETISADRECEIYDLTWKRDKNDSDVKKFRFYINSQTALPIKIEYFAKLPGDSDFTPDGKIEFDYPSDDQIAEVKNSLLKP